MKLVYAGTPAFATAPLMSLYAAGYRIAAVLTQPDKPQGRKGVLTPSPVKSLAEKLHIPVLQPERLKTDCSALAAVNADIMITCAYGQILTQEVLDLFPLGVWNIHASLLPAYRGAAPIPRVIIDGCTETGITVMKTDIGLDTGDIFLQEKIGISPADTCGTLSEKLSLLGAQMIVGAVDKIAAGKAELKPQGEGTVCKKVARTYVDFSRPAAEVSALIRGLSPAPLSFATVGGLTLNFYQAEASEEESGLPFGTVLTENPKQGLKVQCGKGTVIVKQLQPAGGKVMSSRDFMNGRKVQKGMRFEDKPVL